MKTKLTDFFWNYFSGKNSNRIGVTIAAVAVTYFFIRIAITIIQKHAV
jgi:hypothetical protein